MNKKLVFFMVTLLMFTMIDSPVYAVDDDYSILPEGDPIVQVEEVTLTYDANGGEASITSVTVEKNNDVVVSDVIPTRDGFKFLGWATTSDATKATYNAGDTITIKHYRDGKLDEVKVTLGKKDAN